MRAQRVTASLAVVCAGLLFGLLFEPQAACADEKLSVRLPWSRVIATEPPDRSMLVELLTRVSRGTLAPPADDSSIDDGAAIVAVTVSDGNAKGITAWGSGVDLDSAASDASLRLRLPEAFTARWWRIDVPFAVETVDDATSATLAGVHGLAVAPRSAVGGSAWLPLEAATLAEAADRIIDPQRIEHGQEETLLRFRTAWAFSDGDEISVDPGGAPPPVDRADAWDAAVGAGAFLERAVGESGRFRYLLPSRSPDDYNILRHSGALWSMIELLEHAPDAALRAAVERGLDFLVRQIRDCRLGPETYRCVIERGEVKLGGQALAALVLLEYSTLTGDDRWAGEADALLEWIRAVQTPAGRFAIHIQTWPGGSVLATASNYYSAQAVLALVVAAERSAESELLVAAAEAARWLREHPSPSGPPNHWELIAIDRLHRHRPSLELARRAARLGAEIVSAQNVDPRWAVGSFGDPPAARAARLEGLAAAIRLLRRAGEETTALESALDLGVAHQLLLQERPATAILRTDPQSWLGGFRWQHHRRAIRIDHVQHNLSALLAWLALREPEPAPHPGQAQRGSMSSL